MSIQPAPGTGAVTPTSWRVVVDDALHRKVKTTRGARRGPSGQHDLSQLALHGCVAG